MMTFMAFVVAFVLGPLLCLLILRLPASTVTTAMLGAAVVAAVVIALRLQTGGGHPGASLVALWAAWVLAVGMVALAISRRATAPAARRWLIVIALCATTLPWFGLATARAML